MVSAGCFKFDASALPQENDKNEKSKWNEVRYILWPNDFFYQLIPMECVA